MPTPEDVITRFYTAFQHKDYTTMQACYADHAVFNDPVFRNLNAAQVRAMWEMLSKSGKDLIIEFGNVSANENRGQAAWTAYYTFSRTGRKVINPIQANFLFNEGKIVEHTDTFNFYRWATQALGTPGLLLGWTPFVRNKVQKSAMKNLEIFMDRSKA